MAQNLLKLLRKISTVNKTDKTRAYMTIKVISLKRTPKRLHEFQRNNAHISFEVFDAIDGSLLDKNSSIMREFFSKELNYSNGAYGCALSHIQLWIEAVEKNKTLTICEDDAILHNDFIRLRDETIQNLPSKWTLCHWTWNLDSYLVAKLFNDTGHALILMNQEEIKENQEIFKRSILTTQALGLVRAFGTACYSITPEGAAELLNKCLPLENIEVYFYGLNRNIPNNGVDIAMNKIYGECKSYVSLPPIAFTPNIHQNSTVQN